MKKVFYLKTCSTCKRIMSELNLSDWELREIKSTPLTADELQELYQKTNSYEDLFSKRSTQIRARGIDHKSLSEDGFHDLLLDHYSFLKRPVFLTEDSIFVGNAKSTIEKLKTYLASV